MEVNDIKKRFDQFEHSIEDAKQMCQQDSKASRQLTDSLRNLDQEAHRAHDMVFNARQQSAELVDCIDRLEDLGDDVKRACQQSAGIGQQTQQAMLDVHRQISDLKHQMH